MESIIKLPPSLEEVSLSRVLEVASSKTASDPEEVKVDRVVPGMTVIMVTQLLFVAFTSSYSDIIFIWSENMENSIPCTHQKNSKMANFIVESYLKS